MPDGTPIFDGFLLTSTLGNTPLPKVDVRQTVDNVRKGRGLPDAGAHGGEAPVRRLLDYLLGP